MPGWETWVERPSGLIKRAGAWQRKGFKGEFAELLLMKVENVLREPISVIDLNF
jgi:hypothetical protein